MSSSSPAGTASERIGKPHHRFHYSNLVYSMLGEVVARLDGRTWYESIQARILQPLELNRTTVGMDGGPAASGYYVPPFSDVPVDEPLLDIGAMDACGGLASTANDLAKWMMFIANPVDEVLSKDTIEEMCQPQIMADVDRWQLGFGLGFMLFRRGERVFVGHTGGMPGHITGSFVHRPSGTAGITLMNTTSAPDPAAVATDLLIKVLEDDPEPPTAWTPGTTIPADLAGILGTWFSEGSPSSSPSRTAPSRPPPKAPPTGSPQPSSKRSPKTSTAPLSGRETGELLRITRDPNGTPTTLHWATYLCTRAPLAFGEWL